MRNRVFPLLLILCLLLCACQKQPTAEGSSKPHAQDSVVLENTQADAEFSSGASASPTESRADTAVNGNSAAPASPKGQGAAQLSDSAVQDSPDAEGNKSNQSPAAAAPSPKQSTVSLIVDCKNAIDYGILNDPNFKDTLPQNGVIFSDGNVQFTEGESVMTVLKRALKAQKTVCQITSGGYVVSIAGLSEKDCGETSGWMYRVNGELPNVSCKYYKLQAGDRVEFIYTCRMGDVGEF